MFDFHEKRKIKSWLFSKPAIILLLAASAFLATSVYDLYGKERATAKKHAERAAELAELIAHADALEAEVTYMQSERGIEEEIRDRFDVVKEGEQAVIILERRPATGTPSAAPEANNKGESPWWHFW